MAPNHIGEVMDTLPTTSPGRRNALPRLRGAKVKGCSILTFRISTHRNRLFGRLCHKRKQKGCPCDGVWIPFDPSQGEYSLGRVQYSEEREG